MPRTRDADSRDEDPLESDQEIASEPVLVMCPFCGKAMSEMADVCPSCGSFIIPDDEPRLTRGWRFVAAILLIMTVLGYVVWRF
jgi:coenzyme F420-reducing hydrogenase beta subunit